MASGGSSTDVREAVPPGRPVWRKAPVRLLRRPALFLSLGAGALLVALTVATFPLFVASAESELLTSTIADPIYTRYGAGITYRANRVAIDRSAPGGGTVLDERRQAFARVAGASPVLGPVAEALAAPAVQVTRPGVSTQGPPLDGRLFAGDGALEHVHVLSGHDGDGIWLPDNIARWLGAGPGDVVDLRDGSHVVSVRVNGVFTAVYAAPRQGYWQPWTPDLYQVCPDCDLPPQFILVGRERLFDLQRRLDHPEVDEVLAAPIRSAPPLSMDDARALRGFAAGFQSRLADAAAPLGPDFTFTAGVDEVLRVTDQRVAGVRGPALVLLVAGLAIAFAAVVSAAVFSASSRPDEAGVFRARGWGPLRVGARAALESALPVLVGGVAGFLVASAAVSVFGPDGVAGGSAVRAALEGAVAVSCVAVAVVGLVTGLLSVAVHEHRARASRIVVWVPWELLALAAALALQRTLETGGGIVRTGQVQTPRAAVFLYPLMLALAVGIFAARLAAVWAVRRARRRGGTRVTAPWLAARRFAASPVLGVVFVVAGTLAVAVFVASQGQVASLRTTLDAKARIFVGSDVEVQVVPGAVPPTHFPLPVTDVQRALDAGTFDGDPQRPFDLLIVDPTTLAGAAFWDHRLSDTPLPELMSRLTATGGGGGPVPVVLANAGALDPGSITVGTREHEVTVVGRATSFPGASSQLPIVVMGADAFRAAFGMAPYQVPSSNSTTELWIPGPTDAALAAVGATPSIRVFVLLTADEVADVPVIVAAVNTFLVLDVLGVVALLLLVVLAVVYLQARQRSRVVASALSDRMGATPRTLRAALAFELGGMLLAAVAVGGLVGVVVTPVIVRAVDPLPTIPPPPLTVAPWTSVAAAAALLAAAALIGAWLADRATRRPSLGEVMRVGGW